MTRQLVGPASVSFCVSKRRREARRLADPAECVWIAASAKWVQRSVEREQEDGAEMGDHYRRVRAGVVDWAP